MVRRRALSIVTASLASVMLGPLGAAHAGAEVDGQATAVEIPGAYIVGGLSTAATYQMHADRFDTPQTDMTASIGVGVFVTETVALELDASITTTRDGYASSAAAPMVVWAFHPNFYAAGRITVVIDPEPDLLVTPAIGATYAFANGIAPFVELDVSSAVGRGDPDLSIAPTAGVSCTF